MPPACSHLSSLCLAAQGTRCPGHAAQEETEAPGSGSCHLESPASPQGQDVPLTLLPVIPGTRQALPHADLRTRPLALRVIQAVSGSCVMTECGTLCDFDVRTLDVPVILHIQCTFNLQNALQGGENVPMEGSRNRPSAGPPGQPENASLPARLA